MLAPAILAAYAGTLEVGDTTEVRVRTTRTEGVPVGPGSPPVDLDFVTQPRAYAHMADRRWDFGLGVSTMLTVPDMQEGLTPSSTPGVTTGPQLYNFLNAAVGWHERTVRLGATEDLSYGLFNSGYLAPLSATGQSTGQTSPQPSTPASGQPAGAPPVQAVQTAPAPQTFTVISSRTALTGVDQVSRRTVISTILSFTVAGGTDSASQTILPLQKSPRADVSVAHTLSPQDQLVTAAYGQASLISSAPCFNASGASVTSATGCELDDRLAQITEILHHRLARSTVLSVGAGASYVSYRQRADQPYSSSFYPSAAADVRQSFGPRGEGVAVLGVRLEPLVDIRTGLVSNRVYGESSVSNPVVGKALAVRLSGYGAQTVPASDPAAATILGGAAEIEWRADRRGHVHLDLGERVVWQDQSSFGTFFSTVAYLAVTAATPALRF
jgi:hypothetical protein